jgi:hypothetical protein
MLFGEWNGGKVVLQIGRIKTECCVCIEVIRICLQNLYIVPVKSRFSSWGLGKPVFAQPTIYAWGFGTVLRSFINIHKYL